MKDLHFLNDEHFNAFLTNTKYLASGSEGECYKLVDNTVLKYLNGPCYEEKSKEELLQFKNIAIPNFIFVKNLVYIRDRIVGVLMQYVVGKSVYNGLQQIKILNLIKAFDDLIKATKSLSEQGIRVDDTATSNMIYNKNRFYLIDTINYKKESNPSQIFKSNMHDLSLNIYESILNREILEFMKTIPEIRDFNLDSNLLINPSYVLNVLLNKLNEYFGYEIKNIKEASKKLNKC